MRDPRFNADDVNPYAPPEVPEPAVTDDAEPHFWSVWVPSALLLQAVLTWTMVQMHESSPRINGMNVIAVVHLAVPVVLALVLTHVSARRLDRQRALIEPQMANVMTWMVALAILDRTFHFPVPWHREWPIFAVAFAISSALCGLTAWWTQRRHLARRLKATATK